MYTVNGVDYLGLSLFSFVAGYGWSGPEADAFDAELGRRSINYEAEVAGGASYAREIGNWGFRCD
jgi:hypothetical protein